MSYPKTKNKKLFFSLIGERSVEYRISLLTHFTPLFQNFLKKSFYLWFSFFFFLFFLVFCVNREKNIDIRTYREVGIGRSCGGYDVYDRWNGLPPLWSALSGFSESDRDPSSKNNVLRAIYNFALLCLIRKRKMKNFFFSLIGERSVEYRNLSIDTFHSPFSKLF